MAHIDRFVLRDDRTIKDRRKYIFESKTVENRFRNFYSYYCKINRRKSNFL